jgi:hypothetical protein
MLILPQDLAVLGFLRAREKGPDFAVLGLLIARIGCIFFLF